MKSFKVLGLLPIIVCAINCGGGSSSSSSASLKGTWEFVLTPNAGVNLAAATDYAVIMQNGSQLSASGSNGSMQGDGCLNNLCSLSGTVSGSTLSLTVTLNYDDSPNEAITVSGTVSPSSTTMAGTWTVTNPCANCGTENGTFTANTVSSIPSGLQ